MDFDTLIFILVVIVIVISNIKKILAESKKKEGAKKKDSLQQLLRGVISRIQEEIVPEAKSVEADEPDIKGSGSMEPEMREPKSGRVTGWESIIGKEIPVEEEKGEEEAYIPIEDDELDLVVAEESETVPEETIETVSQRPSRAKIPEQPWIPEYSVNELRKAIIWSEILAPPIGLRED